MDGSRKRVKSRVRPDGLSDRIAKAKNSGRYIITVSYFDGTEYQHFQETKRFTKVDILPTMNEVKDLVLNGNGIKKWE